MRLRIFAAVVAAIAAATALAVPGITATAYAHQGNPNFSSDVTAVEPSADGLEAEVTNLDDSLVLTSRGHTVEVEGYKGEPYARILPDGTVQMNTRSPAYWLNQDRYAATDVPESADEDAAPEWKTLRSDGRLEWHDHRIHWMAEGTPPQVKDEGERTKVFDWTVPISVDGTPTEVTGELFWVPEEGGFPLAAGIALALIALLAVGFVVVIRRRRGDAGPGGGSGGESKEAW